MNASNSSNRIPGTPKSSSTNAAAWAACIALLGLGGIRPDDVVYPTAFVDGENEPLEGANRYVLDIYIQRSSPGADKEANWLPAPATGPFNLTLRIYWPTQRVLEGVYKLPPVKKVR